MYELVGVAEIAEMIGVSKQRVHQLASREDFPRPVASLIAGTIWRRDDIVDWARRTGRLPAEGDDA